MPTGSKLRDIDREGEKISINQNMFDCSENVVYFSFLFYFSSLKWSLYKKKMNSLFYIIQSEQKYQVGKSRANNV